MGTASGPGGFAHSTTGSAETSSLEDFDRTSFACLTPAALILRVENMIPPAVAPWLFLVLFVAASFLMIWRLESMTENGMEGTVLGTLIMPYCSGMGNLVFALVVGVNGTSTALKW